MDPGLSGRETYEQIIAIRPKQRAIIVSGFSENEEVSQTQAMGAGAFVRKPYTLQQIGQAVKEALG
jgi:DNA-binding NarL/FixJ family response regulator